MRLSDFAIVGSFAAFLWWAAAGGALPNLPWPDVVNPAPTVKATAATFIYEKDDHAVPDPVHFALQQLNAKHGIIATAIDQNVVDGTGDTPEQYKVPLAEAKKVGLPTLVVMAGAEVVKVVKNPTTEAAVLEAIQ